MKIVRRGKETTSLICSSLKNGRAVMWLLFCAFFPFRAQSVIDCKALLDVCVCRRWSISIISWPGIHRFDRLMKFKFGCFFLPRFCPHPTLHTRPWPRFSSPFLCCRAALTRCDEQDLSLQLRRRAIERRKQNRSILVLNRRDRVDVCIGDGGKWRKQLSMGDRL